MTLEEIDALISTALNIEVFQDIDTINGIQVANTSPSQKPITCIAIAVDSSIPIIHAAAAHHADMLLVHHGLFWGRALPITQSMHEKVHTLISHDMALYAVHLPLDAHMKLGNNAHLAQKIGLHHCAPFAMHNGTHIGVRGLLSSAKTPQDILKTLYAYPHTKGTQTRKIADEPQGCLPYTARYNIESHAVAHAHSSQNTLRPLSTALHGRQKVRNIAIVSGTGHSFLDESHAHGVEMLITGDASHVAALRAEELGIHLISAGHYFTEIWGPLALGAHIHTLCKKHASTKTKGLRVLFLDKPTEH